MIREGGSVDLSRTYCKGQSNTRLIFIDPKQKLPKFGRKGCSKFSEQHYWKENVIGHPYFLPKIRVHVYFVRQMLEKKCH